MNEIYLYILQIFKVQCQYIALNKISNTGKTKWKSQNETN